MSKRRKIDLNSAPASAAIKPYPWAFRARFRRNTFSWKSSQPAIARIREAVTEIKRVARHEPLVAAEGAVLFLERLSPALEHVDSSSGALGSAVNGAIADLTPVVAASAAVPALHEQLLERLWEAYQSDDIPYIEALGDEWGELCADVEIASAWADRLMEGCLLAWSPDPHLRGFFKGTSNCLTALLKAQRYEDVLRLLERAPYDLWSYHQFGVQALAALGRGAEAIRYAQSKGAENPTAAAQACEQILLSSGSIDEAYANFALDAHRAGTYLAWFRAVVKHYPHKPRAEVLRDLVAHTPGAEGKWFAAAKDAGLLDEAIALANQTPCDPRTLVRAARDFKSKDPRFAIEAGMAALRWLVAGYGHEITSMEVLDAFNFIQQAAFNAGNASETLARIRALLATEQSAEKFVTKVLSKLLIADQ